MPVFKRQLVNTIVSKVEEPRTSPILLVGPRQTGKTTALHQALEEIKNLEGPEFISTYYNFEEEENLTTKKLREVWRKARKTAGSKQDSLLIFDEVHRVPHGLSAVQALWDDDTCRGRRLKVILTGSPPLLCEKGSENFAGRVKLIYSPHWSLAECIQAFDYSLEDYLLFGGYPGAARIKDDETQWLAYLREAIIEATLAKDVLLAEDVRKPAALTELFFLGAAYSSQEVSYRKLLGLLQDAGNTDTVKNHLRLLKNAGLVTGLFKYDECSAKTRGSSPRLMSFDPSLMTAVSLMSQRELLGDSLALSRVIENAVGAALLARSRVEGFDLFWWREGEREVDFIIKKGAKRTAIEVKSGRKKNRNGLKAFLEKYPSTYTFVVGTPNYTLKDFLLGKIPLFQ